MKLNKSALTIIAAALLPAFAHAGTDAVATSFERDLYREPVNFAVGPGGAADPLAGLFYAALNGTNDPVLASFERDMYREPVNAVAVITAANDPLLDAFNAALGNEVEKPFRQAAITGNHSLSD